MRNQSNYSKCVQITIYEGIPELDDPPFEYSHMKNNHFLNQPVFLSGHRKSGTTLLVMLFDGHPCLLTYPADSGFFYLYYPLWNDPSYTKDQKISRMIEKVIGSLRIEISKLPQAKQDIISFPFSEFEKVFRDTAFRTECTPRHMLESLMLSFREMVDVSDLLLGFVEKTSSSEIYVSDIVDWFPNARFIHLLRDPRDNWASLRSGWEKKYQHQNDSLSILLQSMIDRGRLAFEFAKKNSSIYGSKIYKVIRYEDLAFKPTDVLKDICNFLGVEFVPEMYRPTIFGLPWKGNNFDGLVFDGISYKNVNRWKKRVPENESALIEFHFGEYMEQFGYEREMGDCLCAAAAKEQYKWYNFAKTYRKGEL